MSEPLTTQEKIRSHLLIYGIKDYFVEKEAEEMVLLALESSNLEAVYIDKDGALVIENE
jgi:hypothetical protein